MSGSHKEFPKKAVFVQLGLAGLVGIGFLFADKPAVHAMADKVTKPIVTAAAKILAPVGKVEVKEESTASAARSGEEIYISTCGSCHNNGIAGAPKLDDKATWETRLSEGFSALVASSIKGKGAMPARGGAPDLSDSEMELTVSHMIKEAGIVLVAKSAAASPAKAPEAEPAVAVKTEITPKVVEEAPKMEAVKEDAEVKTAVVEATEEAKAEVVETKEAIKTEVVEKATEVVAETKEIVAAKVEEVTEKVEEVKTEALAAVTSTATAIAAVASTTTEETVVDHSAGEAIYKNSCFACHDSGVAGSPKIGDKDAWSSRIAAGAESMHQAAINGIGAMPAKGGNMGISDDDVKAAVDYMAAKSM